MPEVLAAYGAYKDVVDRQVPDLRTRARARLGRTIHDHRTKRPVRTDQQTVAKELGIVVEQVRRYEAEWRKWQREHPGEEP